MEQEAECDSVEVLQIHGGDGDGADILSTSILAES